MSYAGVPADGGAGDRVLLLPAAARAPQPARRHHVRRRAADAGHVAGAGVRPGAADPRRAVHGPGAADRRRALRDRRPDRRERRLDPVHRAVRAHRPAGLRLRGRHDRRARRRHRRTGRDPGRPCPTSSWEGRHEALLDPVVAAGLAALGAAAAARSGAGATSTARVEPSAGAPGACGYSSQAIATPVKVEIFEPTIPIPTLPQAELEFGYTKVMADCGSDQGPGQLPVAGRRGRRGAQDHRRAARPAARARPIADRATRSRSTRRTRPAPTEDEQSPSPAR